MHHLPEYDAWALACFDDVWQACSDTDAFSVRRGPDAEPGAARRAGAEPHVPRARPSRAPAPPPGALAGLHPRGRARRRRHPAHDGPTTRWRRSCAQRSVRRVRGVREPGQRCASPRPKAGIPGDDVDPSAGCSTMRSPASPVRRAPPKPTPTAMGQVFGDLHERVAQARADRAQAFGMLADLLDAEVDGRPLDDAQIAAELHTLLVTGSETVELATAACAAPAGPAPRRRRPGSSPTPGWRSGPSPRRSATTTRPTCCAEWSGGTRRSAGRTSGRGRECCSSGRRPIATSASSTGPTSSTSTGGRPVRCSSATVSTSASASTSRCRWGRVLLGELVAAVDRLRRRPRRACGADGVSSSRATTRCTDHGHPSLRLSGRTTSGGTARHRLAAPTGAPSLAGTGTAATWGRRRAPAPRGPRSPSRSASPHLLARRCSAHTPQGIIRALGRAHRCSGEAPRRDPTGDVHRPGPVTGRLVDDDPTARSVIARSLHHRHDPSAIGDQRRRDLDRPRDRPSSRRDRPAEPMPVGVVAHEVAPPSASIHTAPARRSPAPRCVRRSRALPAPRPYGSPRGCPGRGRTASPRSQPHRRGVDREAVEAPRPATITGSPIARRDPLDVDAGRRRRRRVHRSPTSSTARSVRITTSVAPMPGRSPCRWWRRSAPRHRDPARPTGRAGRGHVGTNASRPTLPGVSVATIRRSLSPGVDQAHPPGARRRRARPIHGRRPHRRTRAPEAGRRGATTARSAGSRSRTPTTARRTHESRGADGRSTVRAGRRGRRPRRRGRAARRRRSRSPARPRRARRSGARRAPTTAGSRPRDRSGVADVLEARVR